MSDLVKRLRGMAAIGWNPIGDDAADEIEALKEAMEEFREALESLCCDARYLSDHEIDGGAPDNRWEDMRIELSRAEELLKATDSNN